MGGWSEGLGEGFGLNVFHGVVGHDLFDFDVVGLEPGEGSGDECGGGVGFAGIEDFYVSEATVVIYGGVEPDVAGVGAASVFGAESLDSSDSASSSVWYTAGSFGIDVDEGSAVVSFVSGLELFRGGGFTVESVSF